MVTTAWGDIDSGSACRVIELGDFAFGAMPISSTQSPMKASSSPASNYAKPSSRPFTVTTMAMMADFFCASIGVLVGGGGQYAKLLAARIRELADAGVAGR